MAGAGGAFNENDIYDTGFSRLSRRVYTSGRNEEINRFGAAVLTRSF